DHLLHGPAHRDHVVVVPHLVPVADRAGGEQAGPAAPHLGQHLVGSADPQIGVVLAGEARVGQVLGGGGGPDGDRHVLDTAPLAQLRVGVGDLVHDVPRDLGGVDQSADLRGDALQRVRVQEV